MANTFSRDIYYDPNTDRYLHRRAEAYYREMERQYGSIKEETTVAPKKTEEPPSSVLLLI